LPAHWLMTDSRVLIADNDGVVRRQLFKRLLDYEIFADCVADGAAAISRLDERSYTMLILDIGLEKSDAYLVLDRVRALPRAQRPIVLALVTSQDSRSLDVDVVQVVLRKPIRIGDLTDLIRSCLRTMGDDTLLRRQRSKPAAANAATAESSDSARTST
jgi:DNA-binding response OmpR family regulator